MRVAQREESTTAAPGAGRTAVAVEMSPIASPISPERRRGLVNNIHAVANQGGVEG
jgi:hypothetical protein